MPAQNTTIGIVIAQAESLGGKVYRGIVLFPG